MALRMVSRFYVTYVDAVRAMADLTAAGIPESDISLIESEDDARLPADVAKDAAQPPAVAGATLGAGIGGGIGVLVGIGAISFPFLDPIAALNWLVPTVIGAIIGAGIGALVGVVTKMGVRSGQAHSFAAGLQRGEHLVMVRVDESRVPQVEAVLARTVVVSQAEAPVPPQPAMTLAETREAIHRDEARIQYSGE
jgi:hypothetical protein